MTKLKTKISTETKYMTKLKTKISIETKYMTKLKTKISTLSTVNIYTNIFIFPGYHVQNLGKIS